MPELPEIKDEAASLTARPKAWAAAIEWPTVLLAVVIHGGWIALTLLHDQAPPALLFILGGWLIAWHGSLQHEAIHGHPTPWRRVNDAVAGLPLSLWLPYEVYRASHLAHHASEHLAHPEHDAESRYLPAGAGWRHAMALAAARAQSTLAGRLVLGPLIEVARFLWGEGGRVVRNAPGSRAVWVRHAVAVGLVWAWLHYVCGLGLVDYLAFFVYPGLSLTLIRSFAEHRASASPAGRVAIVERAPLLGLLFLNNNLHAVHHQWPGLSWWRLPGRYRAHREALLAANGGLVYAGYADVFRRFFFRAHDVVVHPLAGRDAA
ncbi:fatty acid desaturase [Phenylobacterium sp.]|uniref:fatty acid desaturase n=1 Tax=Phenylobacterium sp. TaxID=1871053 RepID=UPI00289991D8|nr:fatty acid desaturase [Phenylobacterium sp.]